ncbi:hypothetical protein GTW59_20470, partial [Streptomyces sp. SID89]|nr:hypothetical protein [Streptomyces sp. SID89]
WVSRVWSGAPGGAREAVTAGSPWLPQVQTAPLVLAAVAAVLACAVRTAAWRARARTGVLVLGWSALMVVPAALDLPYPAALVVEGLVTAGLLATAARSRTGRSVTDALPASV